MKNLFLTISLIITITACASHQAVDENIFDNDKMANGPIVVTVDGVKIHQGFLDTLGELDPRIKQQLGNPLQRSKILNSIVDRQLLFQEAIDRNLPAQDDVQYKLALNVYSTIANMMLEDELKKEMKKEYDAQKDEKFTKVEISILSAEFKPAEEPAKKPEKAVKGKDAKKPAAQNSTTVTADDKAKALDRIKKMKARLDKGDDFATVAKDNSDNKMTNKKGGSAGQIAKDDQRFARLGLQSLVDEAFKLKNGEVSQPIEGKDGYYLVKVTSDPIIVPFEEAERVLMFSVQSKVKEELIGKLRKSAKIEFAESEKVEPEATPTPVANPGEQPIAVPTPKPEATQPVAPKPTEPKVK